MALITDNTNLMIFKTLGPVLPRAFIHTDFAVGVNHVVHLASLTIWEIYRKTVGINHVR